MIIIPEQKSIPPSSHDLLTYTITKHQTTKSARASAPISPSPPPAIPIASSPRDARGTASAMHRDQDQDQGRVGKLGRYMIFDYVQRA